MGLFTFYHISGKMLVRGNPFFPDKTITEVKSHTKVWERKVEEGVCVGVCVSGGCVGVGVGVGCMCGCGCAGGGMREKVPLAG